MLQEVPFNGINNVVFLKLLLCDQLKCSKEELDFKVVTSFLLEHRGLVKINCLWPLCNLRKLNLSSNAIKRIENLDSLTLLENLDLSFNEIGKIENLETLTKLRRLSLYANRVEVLENMENLKNLKILNVGANRIADQTCPFFLAQFKNLRCLVLSENPCYAQPDNEIDDYLLALMPQLLDLNNRRVTEKDRYLASTHYKMKTRGLKKFGIGKGDALKSKHKEKRERPEATIEEKMYRELFADYKCFLELGREGEVFRTLNQKFEVKVKDLFQRAFACGDQLRKKFEYHKRVLEDLEMESAEAQKRFISGVSDCLHSDGNDKRKTLKNCRKTLLAEECDTQARFEKLFDEMDKKLRTESIQQIENLNDICVRLKNEVDSYVESVFKLVANNLRKQGAANGENLTRNHWDTIDLNEFEATFRQHCELFVEDVRCNVMKELVDWGKQFTDMFQSNLTRHRKSVAKIVEAVASLNVN